MSRTDKTDPYIVRIWYAADRVILHDHADGPCDAPTSLDEAIAATTRCTYDTVTWFACNCVVCRGPWPRIDARRVRHDGRRRLREASKAARAADLDALADVSGHGRRLR